MPRLLPAALILLALVCCPAATAADRRPNVILFLVDDMGWMDSTPYGSTYYDTPNMQRLANQGMRFTRAYSQPICSPTRACLLTGQSAARHGIIVPAGHQPPVARSLPISGPANVPVLYPASQTYLDPAAYTLAEALRDAGYRTGHFGKWHLGLTEPHWPERQGFDVAFHCNPDPGPPGGYFSPYGVSPPGTDPPKGAKRVFGTITDGPPGEYITDRLSDEAIRFVEESVAADKQRPFFLNLWHYGVHGPWGHKESLTAEMANRTDPSGRQDNPVMASMLKSVDDSLGRLLDTLDRLGIADDTLVIFTSDNGGNTHSNTQSDAKTDTQSDTQSEPTRKRAQSSPTQASYRKWAGYRPPTNNTPLRDGKGTLYEGGVRVPHMVRFPGRVKPGSTSDALVGCTDVYPTVLELAGLARRPDHPIDGVSYAAALRGEARPTRDSYVIWFPVQRGGVNAYQGDWKLIRRYQPRPGEYEGTRELFNLADDVAETTNLAARMPDKVQELDAIIDRLILDTGALAPQPNPAYRSAPQPSEAARSFTGLVAQQCTAKPIAGGYRIEGTAARPYLGTAQVKLAGPIHLQFRIRAPAGGRGMVKWRTASEKDLPKDRSGVPFTLAAGDQWQDVLLDLPIEGTSAIIQLHLPAASAPVDIASIRYTSGDRAHAWDFSGVTP
jgi:arylsulfatase A-like enzyme